MGIVRTITKIVVNAFIVIIIGLLLMIVYGKFATTIGNNKYPSYFGYTLFEIASGSMEPTLNIDDVILVKIDNSRLEKDDIISYVQDNNIITHRIIDIYDDSYIVKGDNNNTIDNPIKQDVIIGRVVKTYPKLGVWKRTLSDPKVLILLCVTLVLFDFALSYKTPKKEDKKKSIDDIKISKIEDNNSKEVKYNVSKPEKFMEFTKTIDLSEVNKIISNKDIKLNKKEISSLEKKFNNANSNKKIIISEKEKEFIEYTIRLDLNEIQKHIGSKVGK